MELYQIKNRRELFIDDLLIWKADGLSRRVHEPHPHPPEPTLTAGYYMTMLRHEGKIHCYARRDFGEFTGENSPFTVKPGWIGEYTSYAQSSGGVKFLEPPLFLYDCGIPNVLHCMKTGTHNFCPFYDENPACPPGEKFKAVAGVCDQGGIFGFVSPDPIHFRPLQDKPLIKPLKKWNYCFDSQNVAFYSVAEKCYVCYFRLNETPDGRKLRTFARMTSPDFRHWHNPVYLNPNLAGEHLYVSQLAPYPRAKHIYIGTPTRYFEDRGSATDITLIFSRAGGTILRPVTGAWIKPGPDPGRWNNRSNYLAYNIIQTKPEELSLYHALSKVRYTLRTDGFISLTAGTNGGEWVSPVLEYDSGTLEFNVATSAGGSFQVELQTPDGKPVPGYSLAESRLFYGDRISYVPEWKSRNVRQLEKRCRLRIRCVMKDCDLYSFGFIKQENEK